MGTRRAGDVQALTGRERDVARLMARGCTNAEIAERLGITFNTAKWHVSQVISKLEVRTREEAVAAWRVEQSPARRFHKAFLALGGIGVGKLALATGGAVIFAGGLAISAVVVAVQASDGGRDGDWAPFTLEAAQATPTATPSPTPTPMLPRQSSETPGCPGYTGSVLAPGPPPCPPEHFEKFTDANAGGVCDLERRGIGAVQANNIDLRDCNLRDIDLRSAAMNDAHFDRSDLSGADLSGGSYHGATFEGAVLAGADLRAVFQNANFAGANLENATTMGGLFEGAGWSNTTCPDGSNSDDAVNGGTCEGTGGIVVAPYWAGGSSRAARTPFHAAELEALDQGGCTFDGADLRGIDLVRLNLANCSFAGANLAGITVKGTSLGGADLRGANLDGTVFQSVDLTAADLSGATGTSVFELVTWDGTICPDGTASGTLWLDDDQTCEGHLGHAR